MVTSDWLDRLASPTLTPHASPLITCPNSRTPCYSLTPKYTPAQLVNRLNTLLLYLLPHHMLSRAMYRLARLRIAPLKNLMIRLFVRRFRVDLNEALKTRPEDYPDFNSFFTRALRPGARPVVAGEDELACPVDGAVSQCGPLQGGRLIQAKGMDYSLETLLGGALPGTGELAEHGVFATLYLSPRDYHRIHMPLRGTLRHMRFIPGKLFSVNAWSAAHVPGLFTRNERVVTVFDSEAGPLVMVLVGAIFVASMETVWAGELHPGGPQDTAYGDSAPPITLEKGAEMGRFNMGSTVIVLMDGRRVALAPHLAPGRAVRMGELLGQMKTGGGGHDDSPGV